MATMEEEKESQTKYMLSYAKSGRAHCKSKKCGDVIAQGEIKITKKFSVPTFQFGMIEHNFHLGCWMRSAARSFTRMTTLPPTVDEFQGFQDISDKDQQLVRKLFKAVQDQDQYKVEEIMGDTGLGGRVTSEEAKVTADTVGNVELLSKGPYDIDCHYYHDDDEKFWMVQSKGRVWMTRYGPGSKPETDDLRKDSNKAIHEEDDEETAQKHCEQKIHEKERKGYRLVSDNSTNRLHIPTGRTKKKSDQKSASKTPRKKAARKGRGKVGGEEEAGESKDESVELPAPPVRARRSSMTDEESADEEYVPSQEMGEETEEEKDEDEDEGEGEDEEQHEEAAGDDERVTSEVSTSSSSRTGGRVRTGAGPSARSSKRRKTESKEASKPVRRSSRRSSLQDKGIHA